MKTSLRCVCAMLAEEAIVLTAYDDGTGTTTIGAGHTAAAGPPVPRSGMTLSLVEAINIFRTDLAKAEREVLTAVKIALSQHQFDALASWHFNTGAISTATLTRKLNTGDVSGAAAEFARWNKSKGKVLDGLIDRRQRETAMFASGEYGNPKVRVLESKGGSEEIFSADQVEALFGGIAAAEDDQSTEELLANPISQLLPRYRPRQSADTTRAVLKKFHTLIPADGRDDAVAVVAVRGYYRDTMGQEGANDRGIYDDAIFVVEPEGVHNFNGNTDPGRFARGIARLQSRQAIRYRPGPHGFARKDGPYPAFRQDSDCTVTRDETGEDTDSPERRFWINLHRGGNTSTSSLGCQTVPPHQWNEFKTLVDGLLKKHTQETFYYLLVEQDDVPQEDTTMSLIRPQTSAPVEINPIEALQQILALIAALRGRQVPAAGDFNLLQEVLRVLSGGEPRSNLPITTNTPQPDPAGPVTPQPDPLVSRSDPMLTPVNGALGKAIGNALNGRKTAIGIVGMLATTVLPIFFPQLAPISAALEPLIEGAGSAGSAVVPPGTAGEAGTARELVAAAFPIFAAMTGWGVMGKVEKWVRALRAGPAMPAGA